MIQKKHPRRLVINRSITAQNQLWETDLKYGYVAGGDRFFFVLSFIDAFTRETVGYHIGLTCEAKSEAWLPDTFTEPNCKVQQGRKRSNEYVDIQSNDTTEMIYSYLPQLVARSEGGWQRE